LQSDWLFSVGNATLKVISSLCTSCGDCCRSNMVTWLEQRSKLWVVVMFFSVRKVSVAEINLLFEVYRNDVLEPGQCGKMVCTLWNWTIVREAADLQWPAHQRWRRVDNAVLKNRNIIVSELQHNSLLSRGMFVKIIHGLGFHKACVHWVLQGPSHSCSSIPLVVVNSSENNILFHHHTPVMKCASMEWEHPGSPWMKKYRVVNSAGKVIGHRVLAP